MHTVSGHMTQVISQKDLNKGKKVTLLGDVFSGL